MRRTLRDPTSSAPALAVSAGAERPGQSHLAEAVAAGVLAQRPPLGNVPSPTPLSIRQRAGRSADTPNVRRASMGQARIPHEATLNLCTSHTASAPADTLLPADATQRLCSAAGDRGKPLGQHFGLAGSGAPSSITPAGEGTSSLVQHSLQPKKGICRTIPPTRTSHPQQPQLLHNDSFCKPRVQGTKGAGDAPGWPQSVCSTCSPHHALERVTGRKQGSPNEEIACKVSDILSPLSGRRKQTSDISSLLYTFKRLFLLKILCCRDTWFR